MNPSPASLPHGCYQFRQMSRFSRRSLLTAGALSSLGLASPLGLPQLFAASNRSGAAKANACIFLFMWGGPSQLDTFDLKPHAPDSVRGPFQPIATKIPGLQLCEHFTRLANHTDKLAVIRSLTHDDPAHLSSGHATVTGQWAPVVRSDATPPSDRDSPHLGSLVSRLQPTLSGLPSFVTLPWKAYHPAAPGGEAPGQHGGWLGPSYDGLLLSGDPNDPNWSPSGLSLPQDLSLARLESRYQLLQHLGRQQDAMQRAQAARHLSDHQQRAFQLLAAPQVRSAFDLNAEPAAVRDAYGRNIHGQCVLMARRLVEHGVPLVTVNWHNDGKNFWDTHGDNFNRLKNDLIPPADQALSALLTDLQDRGMLDETLVVWVGEFGRRPQITADNAGREHWPRCYSGLMAGGGICGGAIYGSSDAHAAYPNSNPVSPLDFATTILHAMGISPDVVLEDREGRPHKIAAGKVIHDLFG